jgi:UDP-4-amino-4,6-dideoxy-N-acetyl-beta-L-altrosamine N-acetyltransferase
MNRGASDHEFIPIDASHLKTVWQWRNSDRVRENMHYDKYITWDEHTHWFEALLQDVNRECWIYRQHSRPVGVLNFSDTQHKTTQWGCYLGEINCAPGSGLILEWAALEYALYCVGCEALEAQVLSFNASALKLHKLFDYERVKIENGGTRRLEQSDVSRYEIHFFNYAMRTWQMRREKVLAKLPKIIQRGCKQVTFLSKELV